MLQSGPRDRGAEASPPPLSTADEVAELAPMLVGPVEVDIADQTAVELGAETEQTGPEPIGQP